MQRLSILATAIWGMAGSCALAVALRGPIQYPMPAYFTDIRLWASTGRIEDTFTPLAYPLFAAPAYRCMGTTGILILQALLYLAIVLLSITILTRLGLPRTWAMLGALPVILHPEVLLSIPKVWDVDLSVFLLLLVVLLILNIQASGPGLWNSLILGTAFGAGLFCRPNFALLAPVVLIVYGKQRASLRSAPASLGALAITSAVVFALLGILSHGSPFIPRNGPYNLYAGTNPYSAHALLDSLNAEPSILPSVLDADPALLPAPATSEALYAPSLESFYKTQSLLFIKRHPFQEFDLIAIKLFTFFRPDTKVYTLRSTHGLLKAVLALPAPLFLILLLLPPRPALDHRDRLLLAIYLCYVVPFLLTNSDPRFRTPLDILLLLHIVRMIYLRTVTAARVSATPKHAAQFALSI